MIDTSPVKWHLAHTSWFFETFVLAAHSPNYRPFQPEFRTLFNSYYNTVGPQPLRTERGLLTRPALADVQAYRRRVDAQMLSLLETAQELAAALLDVIELGIHHEQQHQELILTDVKHLFSRNPLRPSYRPSAPSPAENSKPLTWHAHAEGLQRVGHTGADFAFDNEKPNHRVFLHAFELTSRLVTNEEYLAFMDDQGYQRPELWLSDGWNAVQRYGWRAPLYWEQDAGCWQLFTLSGPRTWRGSEPVCHVSYYEADAFARWARARLPREAEWELAAQQQTVRGNFCEAGFLHPVPVSSESNGGPAQLFGDVWEWTQSPYLPYPGYAPPAGALGEYNGKFMCNQIVLRGGSCATPASHIRATYRNFFFPEARWQFSGIRLARDL